MALLLGVVLAAAAADPSVQPALDLIERNFGALARAAFDLGIDPERGCGDGVRAPCFSVSQTGEPESQARVKVTASSMTELTYGIGYYTRHICNLTVGRDKWGGSHTDAATWPCTPAVAKVRSVVL